MSDNPLADWIGHEISINGIRWRVIEVNDPNDLSDLASVRYERIYDKPLPIPPILRDPPPLTFPHPLETT